MKPSKTKQEQKLFNKYKHWISYNGLIPQRVINDFKNDLEKLEL